MRLNEIAVDGRPPLLYSILQKRLADGKETWASIMGDQATNYWSGKILHIELRDAVGSIWIFRAAESTSDNEPIYDTPIRTFDDEFTITTDKQGHATLEKV
jgi:hypothetical protein